MQTNFYKSTLGNRNFLKLLNKFLLASAEISFFNRLKLRKGASWTAQTLQFLVKIFSMCGFSSSIILQNSRRELLSLRRKFKKYENFSNVLIHFSILFLQYLFKGTFSEVQIFNLWFQKFCSHRLLGHSSLIIYWCSLVLFLGFILPHIFPIDILLSSQCSLSFQDGQVGQRVKFFL